MDVAHPAAAVGELTDVPAGFALEQNYPNPFNPVTRIAYRIREAGEYRLEVFNRSDGRSGRYSAITGMPEPMILKWMLRSCLPGSISIP
ncbi:MAG: hypothetical protein U5N26_01860 [Candidatus Marinimicrobia bacterium]|nr:hypothetical protein [Candidatus Neomarinimicrobiota bacterium]